MSDTKEPNEKKRLGLHEMRSSQLLCMLIQPDSLMEIAKGPEWEDDFESEASVEEFAAPIIQAILQEIDRRLPIPSVVPAVDPSLPIKTEIADEDLELHSWPYRLTGGQHVGRTETGVLIVHKSGIAVAVCSERSQHANKTLAMQRLRRALEITEFESREWSMR